MIFGIDRWPDAQPALRSDGGKLWDYGTLRAAAEAVGSSLEGRSLVFILCRNVPEAAAGYLGILDQGSAALLLGEHTDGEQLAALYDIYGPSYIWMPLDCSFPESCGCSSDALLTVEGYGLFATGMASYEMDPELSLLLSTSGSTGSPKLIRLSRRNLESNASSIAQYLELNSSERPLTVLPMQYTFGLSVINSHLSVGACVLMTVNSIVQQGFWDYLKEFKGTSLSGVPYTYELLHRIHFTERPDTGSLTSLIQAGGHLPAELQEFYGRWAEERGIRFYVMYGQTEATARMSYLPWQDCLRKIGTIGVAIPGGRFELQDEQGQVITECGVTGELVYYGPNVSLGYAACREDLNRPDDNRGVLHTGDMASVDEEGYYTIRGRRSRFVKLYGIRVGLDECENILKGLDEDAIFACSGSDDHLVIFTDSSRYMDAAEYLADRTGINIRAFEARYLAEIPVKETGKIDHASLRKMC